MGGRLRLMVVAAALLAEPEPAVAQVARAYVLDQKARTLTLLDLPGGPVTKTATLQGSPSRLLRTADGARVMVLDRGEGREPVMTASRQRRARRRPSSTAARWPSRAESSSDGASNR